MERVAFLIEDTNERLGCLLNPESLVIRRAAGVRPARSATGQLTGAGLADDPLLFTGGGRTELDLDLLFDVTFAGSTASTDDVRDLTGPLWRLAENTRSRDGFGRPAAARFIWGKNWNIPGVVVAVAERLEHFTPAGVPRRSWLRLRMLRVADTSPVSVGPGVSLPSLIAARRLSESRQAAYQIVGGAPTLSALAPGYELAALEPEPSLGEAVVTAGRIIWESLVETTAGQAIGQACRRVGAFVESIGAEVAAWLSSDSTFLKGIAQGVSQAAGEIAGAIGGVVSAAKTRIVRAVTAAAAAVSAAAGRIGRALKRAVDAASREVARRLEPLLAELRPVMRALGQAAAVIATAVRAKAARYIAAAGSYLRVAAGAARDSLAVLNQALSPLAAQAGTAIGSALDRIGSVVEAVLTTGGRTAARAVPATLAQIGRSVEVLWAAGQRAVAGTLRGLMNGMAYAFRGLAASDEALGAVEPREAASLLASSSGIVSATLAASPAPAEEAREAIAQAVDRITSCAAELEARAEPETQAQIAEAVAIVSEALAAPQVDVSAVNQALDVIRDAGPVVLTQETAQAAQAVIAAVAADQEQGEPAAAETESPRWPGPPLQGGAVGSVVAHIAEGDRLDTIAHRHLADAAYWRLLAMVNDIADPLRITAGQILRIPSAAALGATP